MALNKSGLEAAIKSLLTEEKGKEAGGSSIDNIAAKLATAIDTFVKTGEVITTVTGSSISGGAVTGVGKANVV